MSVERKYSALSMVDKKTNKEQYKSGKRRKYRGGVDGENSQ